MTTLPNPNQPVLGRIAQPTRARFLSCPRGAVASPLLPGSPCSQRAPARQDHDGSSVREKSVAPLIYAVDDDPDVAGLYVLLLETAGYRVRAFTDRVEALNAMTVGPAKPDLLITDYAGLSMPADAFMRRCLDIHPPLRILMASGFDRLHMRFTQAGPDRYLPKPFTPVELRSEVGATLAIPQSIPSAK